MHAYKHIALKAAEPRAPTVQGGAPAPAITAPPRHSFAGVAVTAAPLGAIQPKLTVGAANDTYEAEADRVAGQVMRMTDAQVQRAETPGEDEDKLQRMPDLQRLTPEEDEDKIQAKPDLQRLTPEEDEDTLQRIPDIQRLTPEEDEDKIQRLTPEEDEDKIQARSDLQRKDTDSFEAGAAVESRIGARRGGGSALPDATRAFMEPRFGADFSRVRIHADSEADQISRDVSARAFTTGSDIYFRQGEYAPSSSGGRELLAHELTHVVQQGVQVPQPAHLQRTRQMPRLLIQPNALQHGRPTAVIQRYFEHQFEGRSSLGKLSEGIRIAMLDKKTVYATEEKIQEANKVLDSSQQATFKLDESRDLYKGDLYKDGVNPEMIRVRPVFKRERVFGDERTQPVQGDRSEDRYEKLETYKNMLRKGLVNIVTLKESVLKLWDEKEKENVENPQVAVWKEFNKQILTLAQSIEIIPILLTLSSKNKTPNRFEYLQIFDRMYEAYIMRLTSKLRPELHMTQLWMTLPNDCRKAAGILTGSLNEKEDLTNPDIGKNYAVKFPGSQMEGWTYHYATVIMKDSENGNTDNLTFETAADFEAGMQQGKSLGFFEMYGTKRPEQTFHYIAWLKNEAYADRVLKESRLSRIANLSIPEGIELNQRLTSEHLISYLTAPSPAAAASSSSSSSSSSASAAATRNTTISSTSSTLSHEQRVKFIKYYIKKYGINPEIEPTIKTNKNWKKKDVLSKTVLGAIVSFELKRESQKPPTSSTSAAPASAAASSNTPAAKSTLTHDEARLAENLKK